ncbi:MAG: sialate O-acetylesterase [Bacteroidota bacterium]
MIKSKFKILGFLIIGLGIIFSFCARPKIYRKYNIYKTNKEWRVNFPQKIDYVDKLPYSDSLYIFIMAGQSNMAGRGFVEPQDTVPNRRIMTIDKSMNWIYAKEPLHFYEPSLTGLDCGMSFAKKLLDSIPEGISIAIIPCAVGGSSIEQWLNNETFRGVTLLDNFKGKVDFVKDYGIIKGIIWHQGESNAKSELIPKYSQRLDSLINGFRVFVKNDTLPVILGELGSYSEPIEKQIKWDSINKIINKLTETDENLAVIETGDLIHKGDKVHFDSESQRILGERFAKKYLELTMPTHNILDK